MKQVMAAVTRLVCTTALLGLVLLVNRSQSGDEGAADTVRCDLDPPTEIAGLETCLARLPLDVELHLDLAAAYRAAGRHADARAAYQRAAAIDPRDADARKRLEAAGPGPR